MLVEISACKSHGKQLHEEIQVPFDSSKIHPAALVKETLILLLVFVTYYLGGTPSNVKERQCYQYLINKIRIIQLFFNYRNILSMDLICTFLRFTLFDLRNIWVCLGYF